MCLAVQGKIVKIRDGKAVVDLGYNKKEFIVADKSLKIGDSVLVQQGIIVEKIE